MTDLNKGMIADFLYDISNIIGDMQYEKIPYEIWIEFDKALNSFEDWANEQRVEIDD